MSAKEKRRRRRKAQWMGLCVLLFFAELVAAAAPAALVALVLIPTGYAARGGPAMGGESLAIAVTFTVAYKGRSGRSLLNRGTVAARWSSNWKVSLAAMPWMALPWLRRDRTGAVLQRMPVLRRSPRPR